MVKSIAPGRSISRILSNGRVSLRGGTALIWKTISLGGLLPIRSCSLPGTHQETSRLPLAARAARLVPVWPCSWRGLPGRRIAADAGGLLHHHFTLTLTPIRSHWEREGVRRYLSVARSGTLRRPGCYPAPCPAECGLSSISKRPRSPDQPGYLHHTRFDAFRQPEMRFGNAV